MGVWLWGVPLYTTLPSCPVITLARHFSCLFDRKLSSQRQYDLSCLVWSLWYAKPRPSYSLYPRPVFTTTTSWSVMSIPTTRRAHKHKFFHSSFRNYTHTPYITHPKGSLPLFSVALRCMVQFSPDTIRAPKIYRFVQRLAPKKHGA